MRFESKPRLDQAEVRVWDEGDPGGGDGVSYRLENEHPGLRLARAAASPASGVRFTAEHGRRVPGQSATNVAADCDPPARLRSAVPDGLADSIKSPTKPGLRRPQGGSPPVGPRSPIREPGERCGLRFMTQTRNLLDHPCRIADCHTPGRNILSHNGSGSDHGPLADRNSRKDDHPVA